MSGKFKGNIRWWGWFLIGLGVPTLALLVWLLRRREEQKPAADVRIEIPLSPRAPEVSEPVPVAKSVPPTPDDLRRIEGIGPKVAGVLQAASITTFARLAATDVDQLRSVLKEAGVRIADPGTWPEQASLAADGNWDALKALQGTLKGGRRVQEEGK